MFKCECGKEVKTKAGLTMHKKKCTYKDAEATKEVEVTNDMPKAVKEPSAKDRLSKVADAIRCCQDAQAKHFLEEEYKSLGGNLADLRK